MIIALYNFDPSNTGEWKLIYLPLSMKAGNNQLNLDYLKSNIFMGVFNPNNDKFMGGPLVRNLAIIFVTTVTIYKLVKK